MLEERIRRMTLEELEHRGCLSSKDRAALESAIERREPMTQPQQAVLVEAIAQVTVQLRQAMH